jgi:cobalt-zinc-cadmium efflux system outer membrane protein
MPSMTSSLVLLSALAAASAPDDDAALAREARLEPITARVLASNPGLAEERARVQSARTRTALAGRLPEPELKYEQWATPLRRPLAWGESGAHMIGLRQTLPALGTLDARTRVAGEEGAAAAATQAIRLRETRAQVRRAFADYYRANRELQLHREHVELTTRLVELARGGYRTGHGSQQDVLRLGLELSRLHRDLAHIEQEQISAQALLNTLMDRPVDAPLGPPAELTPTPPAASGAEQRAELRAAQAMVRRGQAALDLARQEGRWPTITLMADYMYMPLMADPHAYGATVMLGLPWLSPGRRDAVKAAEEGLQAERHALHAARNLVRYELRDARARYEAARSTFTIVDSELLGQAQRTFDAAYGAYAAGQGDASGLIDALRSYLEVRLDRVRALVHLDEMATDLARVSEDAP